MKTSVKKLVQKVKGMIFFLAMLPVAVIHHILVVARLPKSVDALITRVYAIIEAMTDNTWFPTPKPPLVEIKSKTDDLKAAQVAAKARTPGAVADRNVKLNILILAVYALRDYVQSICDANPESAVAIAESALFYVKKVSTGSKFVFSAVCKNSGSVELTGSIKANRCSHDWQMSKTPEVESSWYETPINSTLQAHTTVDNLNPGDKIFFRHRCVTKDGPMEWDQYISIIIS